MTDKPDEMPWPNVGDWIRVSHPTMNAYEYLVIPRREARALLADRKALRELCEMVKELPETTGGEIGFEDALCKAIGEAEKLWRERFEGGGE